MLPSSSNSPFPSAISTVSAVARRCLRILYADDVRELREVARISFAREGHGIECVADGALALARVMAEPGFDLVITDHHMPNMNGLELVGKLREHHFAGKIMVFSSELSETVARQYRDHAVDRILYKPVFPSMLRKTMNELFPSPEAPAPTPGADTRTASA